MTTELDHVYVLTSVGAEAAARLAAFGLTEGSPNVHPGQGTACRRFFFENAYIELLWVTDTVEAQSETVAPTHLWERWSRRQQGGCPFGLAFRPSAPGLTALPFPFWEYRPPYLPPSTCIQVATNAGVLAEPMLFSLPFAQRPDSQPPPKRQPLDHAAGLREITRVEIIGPSVGVMSPALRTLGESYPLRVREGAEHLLEVGFNGEAQGRSEDFRPQMPLVVYW